MIAYGICIGSDEKFNTMARPGLARCAAPDAAIAESRDNDSIFSAYNEILDHFSVNADLEALVLLHHDVELLDPNFETKIRSVLADPAVAVVGAIGAVAVRSLAWWEADTRGRCQESERMIDFGGGTHEVDAVDGLLLALSPWAVRNLRFDELTYSGFHAYDMDICFQARQADRRVMVTEIDLIHHTAGRTIDGGWRFAPNDAFVRKWGSQSAGMAQLTRSSVGEAGNQTASGSSTP